jgi:hypothetical protein
MIKKLFATLILFIILVASLLFISISMIDKNKLLNEFAQIVKIDASMMKVDDFFLEFSPSPHLHIKQISQDEKLIIRDAEIYFSPFSLLSFAPQISDIKVGEARIYLENSSLGILNHDQFFLQVFANNVISTRAYINKLVFINTAGESALVIEKFRSTAVSAEKLSFVGVIDGVGGITAAINRSGDEIFFKLAANDEYTDFILEETYKNNNLESGKFYIESSEISYKIAQCIPDFAEFSQRMNGNDKVKITFDIAPTSTYVNLKNIIVNSNTISGVGEFNLSKDEKNISEVNLRFTNIDFDAWMNAVDNNNQDFVGNYSTNKHFEFKNNPTNINIFAKNVRLGESNSISDLSMQGKIEDGKLNIQNFTGGMGGDGTFKITGVVTQNSFRSLFEGKVVFNHKDLNDLAEYFGGADMRSSEAIPFSFSSDVKMSSVDVSLQNLLIKTKATNLMGNVSTKYIGNSPRTNATLKISSVDVDQKNFPIVSQVFNHAISLFDGMKEEDYLSRFIPVRKINTIGNYDITFETLTAQNKLYKNLNFNLALSPGKISFEKLTIKNDDEWLDTSLTLEAQGLKPVIYFKIHDAVLSSNFLSPSKMLDLRSKIIDNYDPSKIDIIMDFYITKLYDENSSLERIFFQAKNDKNLLDIKRFDADLLGGRLQSSGSILLEPYTLNFVYALNSAHVAEIAKLLPEGMLESGGVISASGMWSTSGETLDAQLYNLYTKSNLLAKGITVRNFSIDDFVQELSRENYNFSDFKEDVKKALLTNKTEIADLKTNIDLTKGVVTLSEMAFKTKYSAAVGSAVFNIYDFNIEAANIFSFYLAKPRDGRSYTDYAPAKMKVNILGNIFSPKKTAETSDLEDMLKARAAQ